MIKNFLNGIIWLSLITIIGCSKNEGPGGDSSIKGKVILREYDKNFKILIREIPAAEEDVYIVYGNSNNLVGDKIVTSYDGSFKFDYLQAGNYKIYVYSEDSTGLLGNKAPIIKEVKIGDDETVDIDTLYKCKAIDPDKGMATITGRIYLVNWLNNFSVIKDTSLAQDLEVFLVYEDHIGYDFRNRTGLDGRYAFYNLLKGNYTFYVYSDNIYGFTQKDTIVEKITIDTNNQIINIPDIYVNKK